MALKFDELKKRVHDYVELEARAEVTSVEFIQRFTLFGREDAVFRAVTTDEKAPEWWVVGGDSPLNLYPTSAFNSADEAYSMHTGLMLRMSARDFDETTDEPEDYEIGYDVFISHASEDKESVARPLAKALDHLDLAVWFDEFELEIGDSLRKSIDQGLATSSYGIVILSPDFFAKNWTEYELNSLTAREMEGQKVILPIWHNVTKADVLKYSPALADKYALTTSDSSIEKIAGKIRGLWGREG